jgi:hypothetical protein
MIKLHKSIQNPKTNRVNQTNRTARIRHQCRKTPVLRCHSCLIKYGVEKMKNI